MMQGHEMFSGWGGMGLGPLPMLIVPLLILALIIWAVRAAFGRRANETSRQASAREILERRFAQGEIDEEEFKTRRNALNQ